MKKKFLNQAASYQGGGVSNDQRGITNERRSSNRKRSGRRSGAILSRRRPASESFSGERLNTR